MVIKERYVRMLEDFLIRFIIIVYTIVAHFAMVVFFFTSGLRIVYINHKPWPYSAMWDDFKEGFQFD